MHEGGGHIASPPGVKLCIGTYFLLSTAAGRTLVFTLQVSVNILTVDQHKSVMTSKDG